MERKTNPGNFEELTAEEKKKKGFTAKEMTGKINQNVDF